MNAGLVDLFGVSDSDEEDLEKILKSKDKLNKQQQQQPLPPEVEKGNIEYKLKLINPTPVRFEHLVTQLKWRLQEGLGEAIYEIGVADNGSLLGLTEDELNKSLQTLKLMADKLGASYNVLRERIIKSNNQKKKSVEILIRKVPEDTEFIDIRIAVLGNIESGKSSIISVLTHNELDNGQGRARLNLLRHIHEIQSGHTSSISNEIMGFNNSAEVQNFGNCVSAEEIFEKSSKIISFIDLAGHSKYMRTTLFGLTSYAPDYSMLLINASNGIVGTTKEHLGFSIALGFRVFIVVNKIDICTSELLKQTLNQLELFLKSPGCNKTPFIVNTNEDALIAAQESVDSKICPIFTVSCVNGTNLDKLKKFLYVLPPIMTSNLNDKENVGTGTRPEFRVDEVFFKKKTGYILSGLVLNGIINEYDKLLLGPFEFGEFIPVQVNTIQRHRVSCRTIRSGQSAAVSIGNSDLIKEKLRKGMVLIHSDLKPIACKEFEAEIFLLFHSNQISKGFQATIHIGNVCQTAFISDMDKNSIKTNESAKVIWKFKSRAEYIKIGSRFIFREGSSKGMGEVKRIMPYDNCSY